MHTETTGTLTRYIEIIGANNQDFYLDGLIFHAIACDPAPPDLDVNGTFEFCASPLPIAPGLLITDPANQIIRSAYVQFWDGFVPAEDRLSCTDANGITSSYNSTYGVLSLTGAATTSEYQSVLRSLIYNNINGTPTTGTREIIISLERYNPITGHYYIFVPSANISWTIARIQSDRSHLFGLQGYLVTVTSDIENDFLLYQMIGNTWLGGSDFYTNESDWYWMTGPEAGTMFWQGNETGTELTYANWNPGTEPNNYNGIDEVFAHIYPPGSSNSGTWNDERANYTAAAYYVEFGDMPGDPAIDINGIVNVNVVTGTPVSPSITGSNSVCPNATAVTYTTTNVPGHNYLWEVAGGTIVSGQGSNSITVDWGGTDPGTVKVTESIGGACSVTTPDYSVFIGDNINPTITCPANVPNVPADAGQCYATGVALGTPTTADNCGVATVTNNAPVQFPVGTSTVTWTVTDVNGRTATCNQTVTVVDTQNPTITCPANVPNVPADAGQCYATGVALGAPTTADNCGVATVTNNAPVQFPVGTSTVTWTVTDVNGRTATCNQTVTVVDTQNPTITCPANVPNVPADAGQCYATGVALGVPTTADNCGVATVTNNAPVQFPVGTTTVTWTVTDVNGRTATCNQTVTVVDTQNPTITCPANVPNVPADAGQCYATGVALGTPTTADNCGVATVTNNAPVQFPVGTTTVTWTVTDVNGRTATCNQTVTVVDTQNPTITCPANVPNVPADVGQCYATGVALGTPTTADNCGVATVTNNAPVQFPVGTSTVTWTVTDVNGRTATCNQTVTVVDTQNPTITCPANVPNVPADAGQCYATGVALGTPTTADNCGVATVTNNAPVQFPVGTSTVTWTVTDVNGRTATCNQTVTVVDTQNPTITCPANVPNVPADAGQCYATGVALGTPTTADNCGVATVTNNAPVQFPVGTSTVTWTVTDVNGRTATCNQTVTVVDTQNPTITCPANVPNVPADAGQCYATGVALGAPTTADNCGVATVTNNAPVQFPVGTTTVTWTVTDVNGRTATCNQTVTVVDTEDPTITCAVPAASYTADAGECYYTVPGAALDPTATDDNCGVQSVVNDFTGTATLAGAQFPVGTTTVIWTVTDIHGNDATCQYDIIVTDDEDPTITCASPAASYTADAGECYYTVPGAALDPTATDDNCGVQSVVNDFTGTATLAGAQFPVGTTTVIWTVTDIHGNDATCQYDIIVTDDEDPTITCASRQRATRLMLESATIRYPVQLLTRQPQTTTAVFRALSMTSPARPLLPAPSSL